MKEGSLVRPAESLYPAMKDSGADPHLGRGAEILTDGPSSIKKIKVVNLKLSIKINISTKKIIHQELLES